MSKNKQIIVLALIEFDGYLLIAKGKTGEYWEFPGGKVESGEDLLQALFREVNEELGLTMDKAQWLMSIPYNYPGKQLELNVFVLSAKPSDFDMSQQLGRENQPIRWVKKEELYRYSFWPANKGILNSLRLPQNYVISPSFEQLWQYDESYFAYQSQQGRTLLQLRVKSKRMAIAKYQQWISYAKKYHLTLQLNSDDVSFFNQCDKQKMKAFYHKIQDDDFKLGIHFTAQALLQANDANYLLGFRSTSCHSQQELTQANQCNVDFAVVSAVKATSSHPSQAPLGWHKFKPLCAQAQMPVYALGGMCSTDLERAQVNGAQGISGISLYLPGI